MLPAHIYSVLRVSRVSQCQAHIHAISKIVKVRGKTAVLDGDFELRQLRKRNDPVYAPITLRMFCERLGDAADVVGERLSIGKIPCTPGKIDSSRLVAQKGVG
jgi:hypothetical protein